MPLIDIFLFVCDQVDSGLVQLDEEQTADLHDAQAQMLAAKAQLQGTDYSRTLLYLTLPVSGDETYSFIDTIRETAQKYYNKMLDYVFEFAKVNQKLIRSAIRSDSLVLLLNIMSQQVMPDICQKLKQVQARGHRMPASPEVMATFFAGGISESLRSWFTSGKKCSEEDIKKQLSDIMRAVYQVENIREQKNDTEPIRADTKSEQHTV